ncbi:HAMP domain-containing histidine kinase [Halorussus gelatinilyticus]|uniref:histidine kinase n=1 Tax=Halorussus gelatinilyticus TaxID=2937524 RepID=A0A8U0IKY0_9EURY|nr:HAMP domain-containing sensor histidine kinase [Halorussus gelatinilyticus]UPW01790.1 HAMP domain-containing histidine kinase [Halorussus gelatinilyticus]
MRRGVAHIVTKSAPWVLAFAGTTYVGLAVGLAVLVVVGNGGGVVGILDFIIVGGPGLVLLYGGYRLPRSDIDPDAYSRVVAWCLAGFAIILGFLGLLDLEPLNPFRITVWSATFSTAIGTASGFLVGMYDARATTQARQLQEQHRQLREQREKLERRQQQLQRQNRRLDSFASLLAHELRNPLSIAQIYHEQAADGDPDAAEEVESALDRIEEMVEVILFIARGQSEQIDQEAVELGAVAEEVWDDIDSSRTSLVVESDQTLLSDAIHLRHLLENLFENAVKHAEEDVTIRVGRLPSGFYVADDGPGIPEDEREAVFEAGYTTDGTGFGLLFVAELAEAYGWDYAITTGTDGGARFEFTNVALGDVAEQRQ